MKDIGLGAAFHGIAAAVRRERNFRIELCAAFYALCFAWLCETELWAKCAVVLCCALVLGLELANSALEALCDRLSTDYDPVLGRIKDMAAGAVLCAALGSLAVAVLVFIREGLWDKLTRPAVWGTLLSALPFALWFIAGRKQWRQKQTRHQSNENRRSL